MNEDSDPIDKLIKSVDELESEMATFDSDTKESILSESFIRKFKKAAVESQKKNDEQFEYSGDENFSPSISSSSTSSSEETTTQEITNSIQQFKEYIKRVSDIRNEEKEKEEDPKIIASSETNNGNDSIKLKKRKKKRKKIIRHKQFETQTIARKNEICILFHAVNAEIIDDCCKGMSVVAFMTCKLPFPNCKTATHKMRLTYKEPVDLNIMEMIDIPSCEDFVNTIDKRSIVIELKSSNQEFLGISTLPLRNFFNIFSQDNGDYLYPENDLPEIGLDGVILVKDPIANINILKLTALFAMGTKEQAKRLIAKQLYTISDHESDETEEESIASVSDSSEALFITRVKTNELIKKEKKKEEEEESIEFPSYIPLPHISKVTVEVIRATGLQEAARQATKTNSYMNLASKVGVNSFVRIRNLLPNRPDQSNEPYCDETKIQAGTFCPVWNYIKETEFVLDEIVYTHFMNSELVLEIYHRISSARIVEKGKTENNILLGVVTISLKGLLTSKSGIHGWFNIYGSSGMIGALEVAIYLDDYTMKSIFPDSNSKILNPKEPYDICRFTFFIEEIDIPEQTLKEACPDLLLEKSPLFTCFYHISYKFFDEKKIESSKYKSSTSARKILLEYVKEFKKVMDPRFVNLLTSEKLVINLYVTITSSDRKNALNTKLLGSIYVDLEPLYERQKISKKKLVFISGIYTLINPKSSNLSGGYMKVKVSCETLSRVAAQQYQTEINLQQKIERDTIAFQRRADKKEISESSSEEELDLIDHFPETCDEEISEDEHIEINRNREEEKLVDLEEEIMTKVKSRRIRAEIIKTFSPRQSTEDVRLTCQKSDEQAETEEILEERKLEQRKLEEEITEEKITEEKILKEKSYEHFEYKIVKEKITEQAPKNHLNICIQEAEHLPMISTSFSLKKIVPSCYVKLVESSEDPNSIFKTRFRTSICQNSLNPKWFYQCRIPIYKHIEKLLFQVWHSVNMSTPDDSSDILVGVCSVDMSGLYYGLKELDGWYHVESKQKDSVIGQMKISVVPDHPLYLEKSSLTDLSLKTDDIFMYSSMKEDLLPSDIPIRLSSGHSDRNSLGYSSTNSSFAEHIIGIEEDPALLRQKLHEEMNDLEELTKRVVTRRHDCE